jgi:saccharopine dehydrogenase (NAD+, L-lysine-forming)
MNALVLGCGEMGQEVVRDLCDYGDFDEILVGSRHPEKTETFLATLTGSPARLLPLRVDAGAPDELVPIMQRADVVVNSTGPNYRYELPVARAAIAAGVNLVDLNDEFEVTLKMFDLDGEARRAGITVVLGLGGSPGINNVLVRAAARQLSSVEEIHTAWVMSGMDPGGPALCAHLLYSLSGRALTVKDGKMVEVRSFLDGKERIDFPSPVGPMDVYHVGHPEPIMLSRSYPMARCVDDKATFNPPEINQLIIHLGDLVRRGDGPLQVGENWVDVMDFAAAFLHDSCKQVTGVPREAALLIQVQGRKNGKAVKVCFSSAGFLAPATGIPASIGAIMLAQGKITATGVLQPELCIDSDDFLYEILTRRNVAKLNGWIDD